MNILYHHRTRGTGVEGVHVLGLIRALRAAGHTVEVVSPPGVQLAEGRHTQAKHQPTIVESLWKRVGRSVPQVIFELMEFAYSAYASWNIGRRLKSNSYDLVYERYAIGNWAGMRQAYRSGVPSILEVNHTSLTPLPRQRSSWFTSITLWIDRQTFRWASGVTVVSEALRQHLVENFNVDSAKIQVLPNAADPVVFDPAEINGSYRRQSGLKDKPVVGYTGRFLPWHGLDLLVRAMPHVIRDVPDAAFLLVGTGPEQGRIHDEIQALGLEAHVVFAGEVEHALLPKYIAAFDVAVLPHSNTYGSPMKVFEYMAMAKPTVAPRLGPVEEVITDELEGLLFSPGDIVEMARSISRLLTDETLRLRMGSRGRKKILDECNWKARVAAVLALCESVNTC